MIKKKFILILLTLILLTLMFSLFYSCEEATPSSSPEETVLNGTWSVTTTPDGGTTDPGDFDITLQYFSKVEISGFTTTYLYTSMASVNVTGGAINGSYDGSGSVFGSIHSLGLVNTGTDFDTDGFDDTISFSGSLSGDTISGNYSGEASGDWSNVSGSFTAIKN